MKDEFDQSILSPTSKENPSPEDFESEVINLEKEIDKVRAEISEHSEEGSDISDLQANLTNLEQRLEEARKNVVSH